METNQINKDDKLWKLAKRRAEFKKHLLTYIVINFLVWGIWIVTGLTRGQLIYPWPMWVTLGWGIGIIFNYIGAYTGYKDNMVQKEYDKLINKQN
jgi:2TM domain